jgi:hypothetical protein
MTAMCLLSRFNRHESESIDDGSMDALFLQKHTHEML